MLTRKTFAVLWAYLSFVSSLVFAAEITSPDGQIAMRVGVMNVPDGVGALTYSIAYEGKPIITDSRLGLEFEEGFWGDRVRIVGQRSRSHEAYWRPTYGERSRVRDAYRETTLTLESVRVPKRTIRLVARVYDEGAAFCYQMERGGEDDVKIIDERSEFRFRGDFPAWAVYSAQGRYQQVPLSKIKPGCERPLTIRVADDIYVALAEARLVDFARTKFAPLPAAATGVKTRLEGHVSLHLPATTPWRVVMIAPSPGKLLENNDLLLNLNDPCAIEDPSWIRPGKVIREVTLTTKGGKACVDFAVRHNLQYIEFDAGWYGHEYSDESDATTISVDPKRSPGPLDLHEMIRYAAERKIGIIVYVNRRALERQLDEILPLYQQWGVAGVKYGFVRVGSQEVTAWLHEAVRKAATHRLMVDIHDEYRPTGYSRTYPNLMTQEGIAGDETSPTNELTLTILFTRMLAGAADNTICYYDGRVQKNASHAYQLAKAVCLYSPWQFVYWYDRPSTAPTRVGGAGGQQRFIGDEPELEFFDRVPTVWDDTRVIHGEIGQYAVIARRSGDDWFVGCMNNDQPRQLDVPLDFLRESTAYKANVYTDDPTLDTRTHVRVGRKTVGSKTVLTIQLPARGGQAIHLVPSKTD